MQRNLQLYGGTGYLFNDEEKSCEALVYEQESRWRTHKMGLENNVTTIAVKKTFCLVIVLSMLFFGVSPYSFALEEEAVFDETGALTPTISVDKDTPPPEEPTEGPDFTDSFSDSPWHPKWWRFEYASSDDGDCQWS